MRLLLDTHAFLWWDAAPERLTRFIRDLLMAEETVVMLSLASVWEMQIKVQSGKLNLRLSLASLIAEQQQNLGLQLLWIDLAHVYALQQLPEVHRDPFDRMMIAQAVIEELPFVSADAALDGYPIRRMW